MALTNARPPAAPLDQEALEELALGYVGRYSTTRAKLRSYLERKVRQRGWSGKGAPDFDRLANRCVKLGYIDEEAYALGKSRSLSARGYGKRRLLEKLRFDGVDAVQAAGAYAHADEQSLEAALRFAQRRRIGPFSSFAADPKVREKWIGAMVRAGHSFGIAKAIAALGPGEDIDEDGLLASARRFED